MDENNLKTHLLCHAPQARKNIQTTDCLVIDEISMISQKIFDQVGDLHVLFTRLCNVGQCTLAVYVSCTFVQN